MKKTIAELEATIEERIAEIAEEYELDTDDINEIRTEEYKKGGWTYDPFPEGEEEERDEDKNGITEAWKKGFKRSE